MTIRTYAIVATVVLVAALANPPAQKHYDKLGRVYPWVYQSLIEEAQDNLRRASGVCGPSGDLMENELLLSPRLAYTSLGVASFVRADPWNPLGSAQPPAPPISFGLLGYVFTKAATEVPDDEDEDTPLKKSEKSKAIDPAAKFFGAYAKFNQAQKLLLQGRKKKAAVTLRDVLAELEELKSEHPDWQPMVVEYRYKKTQEALASIPAAQQSDPQ